ncbi:Tetrachloroethene reductive dehalogenase TceA membrane-bound subunit [Dehalococcoides mccartyi]|nr:Tetrachloroethene reductive dehalogenase TceA membrane-bound subunit [Dehalococcoides mccartyi]RAL70104.1 Tetrachloroethene reductive dehalogenase TceA membrane-bound subunit [Dehalococcoides mccartyi]
MLLTVQNFIGSFLEYEPRAAYMFLLVTGLPSLVLLGVAWQLAARRVKKA